MATERDQAKDPDIRASGIGASDSPAILGVGFGEKSPLTVYEEKIGLVPAPSAERMLWGSLFEAPIADEYARRAGVKVRRIGKSIRHPDYEWLIAHPDRYIENEQALLEVKTANAFMRDKWGEEGTDEIPVNYMVQCQHQLIVHRRMRRVIVAVVIDNSEMRTYEVRPDREIQQAIIESSHELWYAHVLKKEPPDPQSVADALRRWPIHTTPPIEADPQILDHVRLLAQAKREQKEAEAKEEAAKFEIMRYMEDHEGLIDSNGRSLVTWKRTKDSRRVDEKRLVAEQPEIAEQYMTTRPGSRQFRLNPKAAQWEI